MKTEAALLVQTGTPLVVAEIEIPVLKPGQVLVDITYSGACGTQVMEWRGDKGEDKWVPHCLGHEATGVVLETGIAVATYFGITSPPSIDARPKSVVSNRPSVLSCGYQNSKSASANIGCAL